MDASRICKRSPMVQGKSSVLTSRVMEVSPFSVWALRRATRSYFWALMEVRVKVSEKRLASPIVVAVYVMWFGQFGRLREVYEYFMFENMGIRIIVLPLRITLALRVIG